MYPLHQEVATELRHRISRYGTMQLSERMARAYRHQMQQFDSDPIARAWHDRYTGRYMPSPRSINDMVDVAAEMAFYFPTHCLKFQHAVVSHLLGPDAAMDASPFGISAITLVDIGAGVGTAALALVDLLAMWSDICLELGHSAQRLTIRVMSVDSNPLKTTIRRNLWASFESQLQQTPIRIQHLPDVVQLFPQDECVARISASLPTDSPLTVFCLSNIVTWIQDWKPAWWKPLLSMVTGHKQVPPYIEAIQQLLMRTPCGLKLMLGSETEKRDYDNGLRKQLQTLTNTIANTVHHMPLMCECMQESIKFRNPEGSYWYHSGREVARDIHFTSAVALLDSGYKAGVLESAASAPLCRLSWFKSRYEAYRGPVMDEVGCKLVETDLDWHMERLARGLVCGGSECWPASPMLHFRQPKPSGGHRVAQVANVMDGAHAICLLMPIARLLRKTSRACSHAYRLDAGKTEFLYEYFGTAHRRYISMVRAALNVPNRRYVSLDIRAFYDSIAQDHARNRLRPYSEPACPAYDRRWDSHVFRPIPGLGSGKGIPIGHPVSGILSNLYLHSLDQHMLSSAARKTYLAYHRYVDDITLVVDEGDGDGAVAQVCSALKDATVDLALNDGKTVSGDYDKYVARSTDQELEQHSSIMALLLSRVYSLPDSWQAAFLQNPQEFPRWYSGVLGQLGIHISARHMLRKLRCRRTVHLGTLYFPMRSRPLEWRSVGTVLGQPGHGWVRAFLAENESWSRTRERVCGSLTGIAMDAYDQITGTTEATREPRSNQRRLRFAAYRLILLGSGTAVPLLDGLLDQPHLVSPTIVAMGLAYHRRTGVLRRGLQSEDQMVRLQCMRYLGELRDPASTRSIWRFTRQHHTAAERLCATEALLRIDDWDEHARAALVHRALSERNPYVAKNYIIIISYVRPDNWLRIVRRLVQSAPHQVTVDAYVYAKRGMGVNLLESDEVEPPYGRDYPDEEWGDMDISGY